MKRSRLSRRLERRTQRNLFLSLLGILAVLFILFQFGVPLLINLTLFISGSKSTPIDSKENVFIASPVLNPLPSATNSAEIVISGIAGPKETINLYLNDEHVDETETEDNGEFSFAQTLKPGENAIQVKARKDTHESNFSQSLIVVFKNAPPALTVNSPSDGQSFSKDQNTVTVTGSTDADVKVTVNDFWAITDERNAFSYTLLLKPGENQIRIDAVDQAGNKAERNLKVIYTP